MAESMKASMLAIGQCVMIAGVPMQFYYWQYDVPVFTHNRDGVQVNYINHEFNMETIFQIQ